METLDLKEQIQRKYVDKEESAQPEVKDEKENVQPQEQPKEETSKAEDLQPKEEVKKPVEEIKETQPKAETKAEDKTIDSALSSLKNAGKTEEKEQPKIDEDFLNQKVQEKVKDGYIPKKTGNDFVDWVLEQHEKGVNITKDWVHNKTKSYEQYDISNPNQAMAVIREDLINQGFTSEEADWKISKKYSALTGDEYSPEDTEYKDAQMALRIDAREAKGKLQKTIEELNAPDGGVETRGLTEEELGKKVNETIDTHFQNVSKDMSEYYKSNLSDYKKESFTVGDTNVDFEITEDMNNQLQEDFANYYSALDRLSVNESGQTDAAKLRQNLLKLRYFDDIVTAIATQRESESKKDFVEKEVKHTEKSSTGTTQVPANGSKPKAENYNSRHDFLKAQIEWKAKNKN